MLIFAPTTQTYCHFRRNNFAFSEPNVMKFSLEVRNKCTFRTPIAALRWRHQKCPNWKSPVYFETDCV